MKRRAFLVRLGALGGVVSFASLRLAQARSKPYRGDVRLPSLKVAPGEVVRFDPNVSTTVVVNGDAVVRGVLEMKPASPEIKHVLRFVNATEAKANRGLLVLGKGRLDLLGADKAAWGHCEGATAGQTSIALDFDPSGWNVGDEIVVCPTAQGDMDGFDQQTVTSIDGRSIGLSAALRFAHPAVTVRPGQVMKPEVANLTRNVVVEGRPRRRAHILFDHTRARQSVRNVEIRHMGPQKNGQTILGKYGLHFHMMHDHSRGSVVEGTVVRHCGSRAFVPHDSHGISFLHCVAYDTQDGAYWWDMPAGGERPWLMPQTYDTTYQDCLAARVTTPPRATGYRMTGFLIGNGRGNVARGCTAVGVVGGRDAAGFVWPAAGGEPWVVEDGVAHNCVQHGIFNWHNAGSKVHATTRFVVYQCSNTGISQGAYRNSYRYEDVTIYACGAESIRLHAVPAPESGEPMRFLRVHCDGAGLHEWEVVTDSHRFGSSLPTVFQECTFAGYGEGQAIYVPARNATTGVADLIDLVDCTFSGNELWFDGMVPTTSTVRFQDPTRQAIAARPAEAEGGIPKPEWRAKVYVIEAFA